ncbi:hypothetical protein MNBD_PLANCTO03-1795 [hydrothermal vent metagenome]|uniref:Fibronectin type-III domain-containing protein n=1 Tax=hydrothermal vent metagenome TaxID=652676 RepID=A0A3B1DV02_9ZZZZ
MSVLPQSDIQMIEWFEERVAGWIADPAAIGLTPDQAASLLTFAGTARAAYQAAQQARNTSKSATVTYHNGSSDLRGFGADLLKTIKAFAEATDDPNVYALADVPPPAAPAPAGPPEPPTDVQGVITNDGAVELSWNGTLAYSTFYEILRKLDDETSWNLISSIGDKKFVDDTLAVGCTAVQYRVRAKRGTDTSAGSEPIIIRLGVEPENTSLNIAA